MREDGRVFRLENGPFGDGPDVIYVRAVEQSDARAFGGTVDGFTPSEVDEVDAEDVPGDADVLDAGGSNFVGETSTGPDDQYEWVRDDDDG